MAAASALTSALSAALGFSLVAVWGVHATPWPEGSDVTVKYEHLSKHLAHYNAIYIGSSEVYRSFVPKVIDESLAKQGHDVRSFNLGGPSMYSHETDYVLRRVLDLPGQDLDYVFVQPGDFDPRPRDVVELSNLLSNRSVFWHDLRQTWSVLRALAHEDDPDRDELELAKEHLKAFCYKMTSYGQGRRILEDLLGEEQEHPVTAERIAVGHGYEPLEALEPELADERRVLLTRNVGGYAEKIRSMVAANRAPLAPDAFCREEIAEQKRMLEEAGIQAIFVVPPSSNDMHWALRLGEEGAIPLVAINSPRHYPQLYTSDSHFDPNHLNREAAILFSSIFAHEVAPLLDESEPADAGADR